MTAPNLFSKLFGPAGDNAPQSLVSPDMLNRIGHHSLISAGLGILGASSQSGASLGGSLAQGLNAGQQTYQQQLQDAEKQSLIGRQTAEQDRITQLRQDVAAKYPDVTDETVPQKINRLTSMAAELAQGGDHTSASSLAQVANALRLSAGTAAKPRFFQQNGKVTRVDPDGTITDIIDDGSLASKQQLAEANLELRKQTVGQAGQRIGLRKVQSFYTRNRKIIDWGHALNQAIRTITDAQGTPLLTSSTISNFVQAADQNARLQIQMLHYMSNIDHSITGWLDVKKSLLTTGKYPPRVYKGLLDHLKNLQGLASREYNSQLTAEAKHDPAAFSNALNAEEMFGADPGDEAAGGSAAPAPGTTPNLDQF